MISSILSGVLKLTTTTKMGHLQSAKRLSAKDQRLQVWEVFTKYFDSWLPVKVLTIKLNP